MRVTAVPLDGYAGLIDNDIMDQDLVPNIDAYSLRGKTAVVTGASSGIGRAIALALAEAGADCLIHARENRAGAEQVVDAVREHGREARLVLADLSDQIQQDELCRAAYDWRDCIDIWINNAGQDVLTGEPLRWSFEEKLRALWQVDVVATMRISRFVGQRMQHSLADATIINMGWDQAEHGMAGDSGEMFSAAKGAVMAFTKSLARSLAPHVRVNCLAPGWIRTAWAEDASEAWQHRAADESLLGRWGKPEDVARVALFLASPAAAFITGQIIAVNGGLQQSRSRGPQ